MKKNILLLLFSLLSFSTLFSQNLSNKGNLTNNTERSDLNLNNAGFADLVSLLTGSKISGYMAFAMAGNPGLTYSVTNPTCPTSSDGMIVGYANGGSGTYTTYNLTGAATVSNSTGIFTGLNSGTYALKVTDNAGNVSPIITNIIIKAPTDLTVSPSTKICLGNSTVLQVSGNSGIYNWIASPPDATLTNPVLDSLEVKPIVTTIYTVTDEPSNPNLIFNGDFKTIGGFSTDYTYFPSFPASTPGSYGMTTNANGCTSHPDTGTATYMLVAQGSILNSGNDKVWCQTVKVQPGKTYTFSYWIQSLLASGTSPANIDITVNGISIGTSLAPATTCGWIQHTYTWASGTDTTAKICIIDKNISAIENRFAVDDISFSTSTDCNLSKTVTITVDNKPELSITGTATTCPNYSAALTFHAPANTNVDFSWASATTSGSDTVHVGSSGIYVYTTPALTEDTVYSLTSTPTNCINPKTGSVTITLDKRCYGPNGSHIYVKATQTGDPICLSFNSSTTLQAEYLRTHTTTDYSVESIPYTPYYAYTGGTEMIFDPALPNIDDTWAPVENLPFNFCFYGTPYSKVLPGANGILSFNVSPSNIGGSSVVNGNEISGSPDAAAANGANPGGHGCSYIINSSNPLGTGNLNFSERGAVLGVYEDLDPRFRGTGTINYYVDGDEPNRAFVFNTNEFPVYNGGSPSPVKQTYQIVLYEASNIIEVNVKKRSGAYSWQSGRGVIGIINMDGNKGLAAPGHDANTSWSEIEKSYRFTPKGNPASGQEIEINWYVGDSKVPFYTDPTAAIADPASIGHSLPVTVSPTVTTTYRVEVVHKNCVGAPSIAVDYVTVTVNPALDVKAPVNKTFCSSAAPPFTGLSVKQDDFIRDGAPDYDYDISYYDNEPDARIGALTNFNPDSYTLADTAVHDIYVRVKSFVDAASCVNIYHFTAQMLNNAGTISYTNNPYCIGSTNVLAITKSPDLTAGGTYTVTTVADPTTITPNITIDPVTGVIDLTTSNTQVGNYLVHYVVPANPSTGCPEYKAVPAPLTINDTCAAVTVDPTKTICLGDTFNLISNGTPPTGTTYAWSLVGGTFTSSSPNPVNVPSPTIAGVYDYQLIVTIAGNPRPAVHTLLTVLAMPVVAFTQAVSSVCTNNPVNVVIQGPAGASVTYKEDGVSHTVTLSTPGGTYTIGTTATNTTYNYELVSSQYTSAPSCVKTYAISDPGAKSTVNVGLPDATIAIQGASPICSGSSSTVRISGTIGASVTYKKDGIVQLAEVIGSGGYVDVATGTLTANSIFELTNVATTGANSCSKTISGQSVTITVIQLPTVTGFSTTTPSICSNTTGTLNFTGTPNSTVVFTDQANTTYPAVAINALGSGTATTLALTADTTFKLVSITMTASPFCSNTTLTPVPVTITVNPLPTVSAPAAITLCEGEAGGTLSVTASGTAPFTYQWYQGSTPYPGGTGSTLNLAAIASNAGSYTCEVTDNCGKKVTSTPSATVTVTAKPVITQQPQTTQPVVCSGSTIDITMIATPATGATYQWFKVTNSPITGNATATTSHLIINNAQVSDSGDYYCVVTTCGAGVTSSILTITVNPLPDVTGFSAVASSVCKNAFGQLVFTGTPGAEVYYTVGSTPYGPVVLDAVTGTKTITTPVAISASTTFTLASVSTTGIPVCTNTTFTGPSTVTIDINALPVINSSPSAATVCEGDPDTVLSVSATGTGLQYEWKLNSGPATIGTNSTLNVPSALANNGNTYYCIVTDACGQTVTSLGATITVTARPVITQNPQGTPPAICTGSSINLNIVATPATGAVSYQWFKVPNIAITGNATASTNNLIITNAQASDSGDYYCVVTTCGPGVPSLSTAITVSPLPEVTSFTTSTASVCYNTKGTLEFAGTPGSEIIYKDQTGTLYPAVTTDATGNATVSTPNLTIPMSYTLVSITMNNAPFCSNTTFTPGAVPIAINPDPIVTIAASAATICEGDAAIIFDATVTPGTGTGPFTYQWKKGTNVVSGATGSTLTLTSQASNSGSYTCTVTDACTRLATSTAIAIVINVKPTITVQPIGSTICSKVSIDLRVAATPAGPGLTYEWQFNGGPISGNPTATTSDLIIANAQVSDSGGYTCIVRNGTCETVSNAAVMTVNQAPVISQQPKAKILCEGDSYTLGVLVTGGTNVAYQWYKDGNILASETNSTLELSPAAVSQTGEYYCIVSSTSCLPETSDKVKVTVKPLPTASITEGPTATICEGSSSEVVFSGTPNAIIVYTINNGPQRTITLDPYGQAVLLTGILAQSATYTLIKVTENDTNACSNTTFGSSQAVITVIPIISPELKDGYICVDTAGNPTRTYLLDTGLKAADGYTFIWTLDGLPLTATGETLTADKIGKYRVEVTNTASGCKGYAEANVQESSPPTGITVNISGFFAENATVVGAATPLPTDNYVYRLDDGPYQESPVFQGVAPGEHVIYAWDTQFCGSESSVPFSVIGYPRFFTPNGDGINDTWGIDNDSFNSISNARIFIFDRFGKLIKEISTVGDGWDGTFNSTPLPADDYWFSIKYQEQGVSKEFKAHFALKR